MEGVAHQMKRGQFLIGDLDSFGVVPRIKLGLDRESAFRPGVGNQVQKDFVADQRLPSPVHADKRKQAMLDLVLLAGSRRKMTNRDGNPDLVRQFLNLHFPESYAGSVAPSAIRSNQKFGGVRVGFRPQALPPPLDRVGSSGRQTPRCRDPFRH